MLLGMFVHGALAYMTIPDSIWPVMDRHRFGGADVISLYIYLFRVPSFYVLSGFFSRLLYLKLGAREFLGNRMKRIALPLAIAVVPVNIAVVAIAAAAGNQPQPSRWLNPWLTSRS